MDYSRIKEMSYVLGRNLVGGPSVVIPNYIVTADDDTAMMGVFYSGGDAVAIDDAVTTLLLRVNDNISYIASKANLSTEEPQSFVEGIVSIVHPDPAKDKPE